MKPTGRTVVSSGPNATHRGMKPERIKALLEDVRTGALTVDTAQARLADAMRAAPFEDVGFARVDHHRAIRQGFPEVVFGQGKTPDQIARIAETIVAAGHRLLVTILIASAGTADHPVADEAAVTADVMGNRVARLDDVGVAGLHRLLAERAQLEQARVVIVVAGMDGALASVVGGLISTPVIAVPTSVGYGASFGGVAALLSMLNSCATGVAVVNIDNGFGAAALASRINHA